MFWAAVGAGFGVSAGMRAAGTCGADPCRMDVILDAAGGEHGTLVQVATVFNWIERRRMSGCRFRASSRAKFTGNA